MPRFYVEPRPYCLTRAQKQNPFFLARAAATSLCKFRRLSGSSGHSINASPVLPLPPPLVLPLPLPLLRCRRRCFFFSLRLPASPPLETTTRASCHHRRLVSHPATAVSSRLQPPPRETTMRALAAVSSHVRPPPRKTTAAVSSLSLSLCKCSGVPLPPREHFRSFAAIVAPRFSLR